MTHFKDSVEIKIEWPVVAETGSAILIHIQGEEVWIPKSQIDRDSEVFEKGQTGRLIVSQWIAGQKGLA